MYLYNLYYLEYVIYIIYMVYGIKVIFKYFGMGVLFINMDYEEVVLRLGFKGCIENFLFI